MPWTSCWPGGTDVAGHVLVVRLDSMGDVLAAGPAIRAVAAKADRVTVLCGPLGLPAAELLPGVDATVVWACPWIMNPPPELSRPDLDELIRRIGRLGIDQAVILTSFHQSPLPTALLLRLAGVRRIAAASEDYPGALLDVRLPVPGDAPEPVRMLQSVRHAGFQLPAGDDGRLQLRRPLPEVHSSLPIAAGVRLVAVHPGTSAPARAYPLPLWASAVDRLVADGWQVALTGSSSEKTMTRQIVAAVSGLGTGTVHDLAGTLDVAHLAAVLDRAQVTVVANTGPAHLSAAVGTPVVSLFAPVVPALRWAPFGVPVKLLGDQYAPCKDTRWTSCQIEGHPCLTSVSAEQVVSAVRLLSSAEPVVEELSIR
jgi:ADP-heptose:LPS heptosyltransferase